VAVGVLAATGALRDAAGAFDGRVGGTAGLLLLPADVPVPEVLDSVVSAAGQALGDLGPAVAELLLHLDDVLPLQGRSKVRRRTIHTEILLEHRCQKGKDKGQEGEE
jgi:hypothetical protein